MGTWLVIAGFLVYAVVCLWLGRAKRFEERRHEAEEWKRERRRAALEDYHRRRRID